MMEVDTDNFHNEESIQESKNTVLESSRLDQLISDYRRVHEAATNEIDRKRRAVRSKCEERLWMSAIWRDYQLEIVKKSFDNEIKQIEREHQSEFNSLKESLMQELQEERKKLLMLEQATNSSVSVDKTGNLVAGKESSGPNSMNDALTAAMMAAAEEQAAVATSRRLRRRDEKATVEGANGLPPLSAGGNAPSVASSNNPTVVASSTSNPTATANSNRRKQVNNIYTYNTMLQEQDILDDLGAIAKEAGSLGTSRRATGVIKTTSASAGGTNVVNNVNVSFEKGSLHYNWDIIKVSDRIRIQLAPNSSAINATVQSCSPSELVIISPSRNQIKIPLLDLKSGKVTIVTASEEDHLLHDN